MTRTRLHLYDTTLRDGQQTQGVQFSTPEKIRIAEALDALGIDYIEGGWPGANPTDSAFFDAAPETRATMTAFGMTKRAGRSADNDEVLAGVMNAGTAAVCLVGKTHDFHVTEALGITLDENVENIAASVAHLVARGARRCSTRSISSTATRPIPTTRSPACAPRSTRARAGSCCATPMAARCPGRSGASPARSSRRAFPGNGWASTPITTPKPPSRAASRRWRPGRGRCRAR
jgi:isopropylmalate/homocitrate/citramalate synthase